MKIGEMVQVLEGAYIGKRGKVEFLATGIDKSVGVRIERSLVWFKPSEVEVNDGRDSQGQREG